MDAACAGARRDRARSGIDVDRARRNVFRGEGDRAACGGDRRGGVGDEVATFRRALRVDVGARRGERDRPARGGDPRRHFQVAPGLRTQALTGAGERDCAVEAQVARGEQDDVRGDRGERRRRNRHRLLREVGVLVDDECIDAAVRIHEQVERVEQQRPRRALRCAQVGAAHEQQVALAGDLGEAAVSARRSALRAQAAEEPGVAVRPDDDAPAVAFRGCVRPQARIGADIGVLRIADRRIRALVIAAREDGAACGCARGVEPRGSGEAHPLSEHFDAPTRTAAAGRGNAARHPRRRAQRLDRHRASRIAVCRSRRARFEPHVTGCTQDDLARFVPHQRAGAYGAGMGEGASEHTHGAAVGDQPAQVEHRVGRCLDFELHAVEVEARDRDLASRGEQDAAAWRLDQPAVLDVRCDQRHAPAVAGADRAPVGDRTGIRACLECELAGEEVRVQHRQGGGDEAGGVDDATRAHHDPGRIDEEHPPVALERAVDLREIGAHHAIEHRARGRLLDEAGDFALPDGEALPVDDGAGRIGDGERGGVRLREPDLPGDHLRTGGIGERPGAECHLDAECENCLGLELRLHRWLPPLTDGQWRDSAPDAPLRSFRTYAVCSRTDSQEWIISIGTPP